MLLRRLRRSWRKELRLLDVRERKRCGEEFYGSIMHWGLHYRILNAFNCSSYRGRLCGYPNFSLVKPWKYTSGPNVMILSSVPSMLFIAPNLMTSTSYSTPNQVHFMLPYLARPAFKFRLRLLPMRVPSHRLNTRTYSTSYPQRPRLPSTTISLPSAS